jgi:hypothetical protein
MTEYHNGDPGSCPDQEFVLDELALEQVFARALQFSPTTYHSTNAPYSSFSAPEIRAVSTISQFQLVGLFVNEWMDQ